MHREHAEFTHDSYTGAHKHQNSDRCNSSRLRAKPFVDNLLTNSETERLLLTQFLQQYVMSYPIRMPNDIPALHVKIPTHVYVHVQNHTVVKLQKVQLTYHTTHAF